MHVTSQALRTTIFAWIWAPCPLPQKRSRRRRHQSRNKSPRTGHGKRTTAPTGTRPIRESPTPLQRQKQRTTLAPILPLKSQGQRTLPQARQTLGLSRILRSCHPIPPPRANRHKTLQRRKKRPGVARIRFARMRLARKSSPLATHPAKKQKALPKDASSRRPPRVP